MPTAPLTENPTSSFNDADPVRPPRRGQGRGWVKWLLFLLLVAGVSFAVWRVVTARRQAAQDAANKQAAALNRPVPVQVVAVQQKTMPIFLTALGTVTPYNSVTLRARVTGAIDRVEFKEGQEVHIGQTLMVIDPRPYQAALDQAKGTLAHDQALLKNAQAEADRYTALYREGVVSKESLDSQVANLGQYTGAIESDQAAIENDALQVKYCYITSPINGRIGLRLVDPGNVITANTTNLIIINQLKPIAVYFTLPEDQLPVVLGKLGRSQKLAADAFDRSDMNLIAPGSLLTADNQIDPTTGTGKLKAVFPNDPEQLFPNQFVNVHLILEQRADAIVIPSAAMQHGNQGDFVWKVNSDNSASMQPVVVRNTEGSSSIVDSGLGSNEQIVVDGADRLRPGIKVQPTQARPSRAASAPAAAPAALDPQALDHRSRTSRGDSRPLPNNDQPGRTPSRGPGL